MKLFLIRHASALDLEDDDLRPLSPQGRRDSVDLGRALAQRGDFHPPQVWHSPLLRAVETAELLLEGLGRRIPLKEIRGIRPEDDPGMILPRLAASSADLAIVGHNPYLGYLGGMLVHPRGDPLLFQKACGYVLEPSGDKRWTILGQLAPLSP
jgi:phosphohistidine phosphatase